MDPTKLLQVGSFLSSFLSTINQTEYTPSEHFSKSFHIAYHHHVYLPGYGPPIHHRHLLRQRQPTPSRPQPKPPMRLSPQSTTLRPLALIPPRKLPPRPALHPLHRQPSSPPVPQPQTPRSDPKQSSNAKTSSTAPAARISSAPTATAATASTSSPPAPSASSASATPTTSKWYPLAFHHPQAHPRLHPARRRHSEASAIAGLVVLASLAILGERGSARRARHGTSAFTVMGARLNSWSGGDTSTMLLVPAAQGPAGTICAPDLDGAAGMLLGWRDPVRLTIVGSCTGGLSALLLTIL